MSWGTDQSFQGFQREAAALCARATRSTTPNMARNIVSHAAVGNVKWMLWGLQCLKHLGYLKQPSKSEYHRIYTTFSPIYTHQQLRILCIYCCHRASSWRKWWFYSLAQSPKVSRLGSVSTLSAAICQDTFGDMRYQPMCVIASL